MLLQGMLAEVPARDMAEVADGEAMEAEVQHHRMAVKSAALLTTGPVTVHQGSRDRVSQLEVTDHSMVMVLHPMLTPPCRSKGL